MSLDPHYQALRRYFQTVDDDQGRLLAAQITAQINTAISQQQASLSPLADWDSTLYDLLQVMPVQPAILALPWQAYYAAQWHNEDEWHTGANVDAILATVPSSYRMDLNTPVDFVAPYEGSLIAYLVDLIKGTKNHLWVINPYWSVTGVERLKRRFERSHTFMSAVTVLTPADMAPETIAGCEAFKTWMYKEGVEVKHLTPLPLQSGKWPLVHAKVMIRDYDRAYIGSANISDNGLVNSIEMGVGLSGPTILHIVKWIESMTAYFETFENTTAHV